MDSYYEDLIKNIRTLMTENQIQDAYRLMNEELALPYVPTYVEHTLKQLQEECRFRLQNTPVTRIYRVEEFKQLLDGNCEEQWKAVNCLKEANIRNFLELIETVLCGSYDRMIKSFLIEALIEQGVSDEMHMVDEGLEYSFIPCYIETPAKAQGTMVAHDILCEWFEHVDPSFLHLAQDALLEEAYLMLPMNIEETESELIAHAIAKYLFSAIGFAQNYDAFREFHQLPETITYDLLLQKRCA
ncbi:MAG: hypothetical protein HFF02_08915 [Erysipelotrichaceae bacterium]|nr:hypothetical protein [Erysipelotrichaceae bacterium]